MAVLKDARPAASLLALAILSPEGQRVLPQRGFRPVTLPGEQVGSLHRTFHREDTGTGVRPQG